MDTELKCNRLTCRSPLSDKAVVTTCSHIFCVECANELFNASRLCPACETVLSEPDDVVVCSLHPSNDYKTVCWKGIYPALATDAISLFFPVWVRLSFWRSAVARYRSGSTKFIKRCISLFAYYANFDLVERHGQIIPASSSPERQRQERPIAETARERPNGEISLLSNKNAELQRDLELERRKVRDLQEAARERDKEYQKLKAQHDKIKRKALLAPGAGPQMSPNEEQLKLKAFGDGGMVSRTPLVTRSGASWGQGHQQQQGLQVPRSARRVQTHRQPFAAGDRVHASNQSYSNASDRSTSSNEVENMLLTSNAARASANHGWQTAPSVSRMKTVPRAVFAPPGAPVQQRMSGNFRAAGMQRSG